LFKKKKLIDGKIRLMIITHDLAIGGLQRVVVQICKNINRDMFEVNVLCLREKGEFAEEIEKMGIKIFLLPREENSKNYLAFVQVAQILRKEKIDLIHTHNIEPFVDGTLGAILAGGRTLIHTDHARNFPDKWKYMFHEWLVSHFAYKIVGVSEHTSENLVKYEKISRKKIITIPNGVDGKELDIPIDRIKKKKSLGLGNAGFIIGVGVRLTEQKGLKYLIKAMQKVVNELPDIRLLIAGDGPLKDRLQKLAVDLGVDENVIFLGARLDIPELLQVFDLYVLPSVWEGLPMVLLEALAAGCPVIATEVGGTATAIKHGVNGSLVPPESPQALSDEIIRLLKNKDQRDQYIINGKKIFRESFSSEVMTKKYEDLYLQKFKIKEK